MVNKGVTDMREELLKGLTEEQIAKLDQCDTAEKMVKLAGEEGIELNDEQLEAVSGGVCEDVSVPCPRCGTNPVEQMYGKRLVKRGLRCPECGYEFHRSDVEG